MKLGFFTMPMHPIGKDWQISLREDILATLRRVQADADELNCGPALEHIYMATNGGSDAHYLREAYNDQGGVEGMVDSALRRFRQD